MYYIERFPPCRLVDCPLKVGKIIVIVYLEKVEEVIHILLCFICG